MQGQGCHSLSLVGDNRARGSGHDTNAEFLTKCGFCLGPSGVLDALESGLRAENRRIGKGGAGEALDCNLKCSARSLAEGVKYCMPQVGLPL
jgi:hypothetical protein